MKEGDIYKWSYNDKKLEQLEYKSEAGTLYWCMSRIAIYNESRKRLCDTYWHSGGSNVSFDKNAINDDIVCVFIANRSDLVSCNENEFNYYDKVDCVNLNHPNSTRGNCYIRRGASKSLKKMEAVIMAHIEHYRRLENSSRGSADRLYKDLESLTVDSHVPCNPDVFI